MNQLLRPFYRSNLIATLFLTSEFGFRAQNERQANKSNPDSRPRESILFSALSGLKDGVHLNGANDDGSLRNRPYESGTFVGGVSNHVVSIEKGVFDSPAMRARKVYRIIKHDGVEYWFDEQGNVVKKFKETKDERELRHGWRRLGATAPTAEIIATSVQEILQNCSRPSPPLNQR